MRKGLIITVILIISLLYIRTSKAEENNILYDRHFIYKIKNINIGNGHVVQKIKKDNGKTYIITSRQSEQKFQRFGFTIKLAQDIQFIEDEAGNPVSFSSVTQNQNEKTKINGEFISVDKVKINSIINGQSKTEEIKLNKNILFPYAIEKLFKNRQQSIQYSTIDPSVDFKIINYSGEKVSEEELSSDNLPGFYAKYKVSLNILPNINSYEWYDSEGRIVKEWASIFNIESVSVPAPSIPSETACFDLLDQSLIPVDISFSDKLFLDQINYKIQIENINPENILISDERQRVIQVTGNTAYLKIKSEQEPAEKFSYPVSIQNMNEFLKTGPFITSNDSSIKSKAMNIIGEEKDAYKIVKKMERWVYSTINKKDFSVNFANAKEVMKTKEGDCTEHSVLLASMLRSAGIPAKIVIGLMYTDRPKSAFAYHMWVKAYIGKWINLDPSFPANSFSPLHIAMYETQLNNVSDRTDMVLNLINSFSKIKITILNSSNLTNNKQNKISYEKLQPDEKFNVSNFINIDNMAEDIELNNFNELIDRAFSDYQEGNIENALKKYRDASGKIKYNDDITAITFAQALAELGFLNLSNEKLNNIYNKEIWNKKINEIREIYFPKKFLAEDKEIILVNIVSKITFNNDVTAAIKILHDHKDLLSSDYTHYILAKAYIKANQFNNALNELNYAISVNPQNLTYRFEAAQIYISQNQLKKAKKEMDYILSRNINNDEFLKTVKLQNYWLNFKLERNNEVKSKYYLAKYYFAKNAPDDAISIMEKLVNSGVSDDMVYDLLGDINYSLNKLDKAKINYEKSVALNKNNVKSLISMGDIEFVNKEYENAIKYYLQAYKINEKSPDTLNKIAETYKFLSNDTDSIEFYYKTLILDKNNFKANKDLGMIYFDFGDYTKAQSYILKAIPIYPFDDSLWLTLARIEILNKNYFLAKNYLIAVNRLNPKSSDYYYNMGIINKYNENFSEAKSDFQTAVKLDPMNIEAVKEFNVMNKINLDEE